jgi:hypothetical protein
MLPRAARTRAVTGLPVALAVGLALCSGCSEQVVSKGHVAGQVRAGAACPTQQQGQVCLPRAVDGEVRALRDGEVKARTRTGPTGRYELSLPAGSYTLVVGVSGPTPQCPQTAVDVRAAGSGTVDIDCA